MGEGKQEIVRGAADVVEMLMLRQGVTRSELARRLNVSRAYVTMTLNSASTSSGGTSLTTLETFANALDHTLLSPIPLPIQRPVGEGRVRPRKGKAK